MSAIRFYDDPWHGALRAQQVQPGKLTSTGREKPRLGPDSMLAPASDSGVRLDLEEALVRRGLPGGRFR